MLLPSKVKLLIPLELIRTPLELLVPLPRILLLIKETKEIAIPLPLTKTAP
ncbi:hypothetical protein MARBORIA2_12920 [Methanobrevibacter arboriphilus]|nr:hypothetical protein MARBORIA2_12920 [Methanobrevibacter arboriphilus]